MCPSFVRHCKLYMFYDVNSVEFPEVKCLSSTNSAYRVYHSLCEAVEEATASVRVCSMSAI